jgi:hypothetical protein
MEYKNHLKMFRRILAISLLFCLIASCDENITSTIPNAPVNLTLDLAGADASLYGSLAYKEYTTPRLATDRLGFGGLLVVNGIGENPIVNLFAYDLACPNEARSNVRIKPENTGLATCPQCGAVYRIAWGGSPESGSRFWLKRYNVLPIQGSDTRYRVTN